MTFDNQLPFTGLKVLDLSSILAGPLTGSFFAELGAQVTKIENKLTHGDATRQWKLPTEDKSSSVSSYYFSANFHKDIKLLDLTDPVQRAKVTILIEQSDVIISNFQKQTATKLGLLPDDIISKYPTKIFAQLSAYDFDDPRPGYDLVMQGETGWISMTGTNQNNLAKLPVALMDVIASHQMKEAILTALWKKATTGSGSILHISLYKSALTALCNQASNYLMGNHLPQPLGTLHPNIAPYGDLFLSKDKIKFLLAVGSDSQFQKLWFSLSFDPEKLLKFDQNMKRLQNREELQVILQQTFELINFATIELNLQHIGIPYCCIKDLSEVFTEPLAIEMIRSQIIDDKPGKSISHIAFKIY
ncbi:MAG: CaiB/BaiF CoA-transferase family protein [Saprospiraceae bacterium]